ncbi:hypothetical protein [Actinomadura nitritigenes]|uniref:hypothetical protein n=1 Tax=Actinomadura nitritigenes TaxID=134602 RepID=UPI003D9399A7
MTTSTRFAQRRAVSSQRSPATAAVPLVCGAMLCLAVTVIHVLDQGGFALQDPGYIGSLYLALEVGGVVAAGMLMFQRPASDRSRVTRRLAPGWWVALGVAVGPLVGYLSSRSIGLPGYTSDIGDWTEPLGLASLAVEGALLVLTLGVLAAHFATGRGSRPA